MSNQDKGWPQWLWPTVRQETGFVIRIGRSLHWIGYAFAGLFGALIILEVGTGNFSGSVGEIVEALLLFVILPATSGRAARYILANE